MKRNEPWEVVEVWVVSSSWLKAPGRRCQAEAATTRPAVYDTHTHTLNTAARSWNYDARMSAIYQNIKSSKSHCTVSIGGLRGCGCVCVCVCEHQLLQSDGSRELDKDRCYIMLALLLFWRLFEDRANEQRERERERERDGEGRMSASDWRWHSFSLLASSTRRSTVRQAAPCTAVMTPSTDHAVTPTSFLRSMSFYASRFAAIMWGRHWSLSYSNLSDHVCASLCAFLSRQTMRKIFWTNSPLHNIRNAAAQHWDRIVNTDYCDFTAKKAWKTHQLTLKFSFDR